MLHSVSDSQVYAYYDLAADAYFKYLNLAGVVEAPGTVSATLRLLHLTVGLYLTIHKYISIFRFIFCPVEDSE